MLEEALNATSYKRNTQTWTYGSAENSKTVNKRKTAIGSLVRPDAGYRDDRHSNWGSRRLRTIGYCEFLGFEAGITLRLLGHGDDECKRRRLMCFLIQARSQRNVARE